MILRRFRHHLSGQDWFAVGLDVLVVIVGIFLGMQVTDWNEERKQKASLQAYYDLLLSDLNEELSDWTNTRIYYQRTRQYGIQALEHMERGDALDPAQIVALYQASQTMIPAHYQTAYTEISAHGLISLIPDKTFKRQLSFHYSNLDSITSMNLINTRYRSYLRAYFDFSIRETIHSQCGDRAFVDENGFSRFKMPETCDLDLSEQQIEKQEALLQAYSDMNIDLRNHLATIDYILTDINFAIESSSSLRDSILHVLKSGTAQ